MLNGDFKMQKSQSYSCWLQISGDTKQEILFYTENVNLNVNLIVNWEKIVWTISIPIDYWKTEIVVI